VVPLRGRRLPPEPAVPEVPPVASCARRLVPPLLPGISCPDRPVARHDGLRLDARVPAPVRHRRPGRAPVGGRGGRPPRDGVPLQRGRRSGDRGTVLQRPSAGLHGPSGSVGADPEHRAHRDLSRVLTVEGAGHHHRLPADGLGGVAHPQRVSPSGRPRADERPVPGAPDSLVNGGDSPTRHGSGPTGAPQDPAVHDRRAGSRIPHSVKRLVPVDLRGPGGIGDDRRDGALRIRGSATTRSTRHDADRDPCRCTGPARGRRRSGRRP
jgi:hypothetical protein